MLTEACGHLSLDEAFLGPLSLPACEQGLGVVAEGGGATGGPSRTSLGLSRLAI